MQRLTRTIIAVLLALFMLGLVACTSNESSSSQRERQSREGSYETQVANQPAHSMAYSPSRNAINFWIDTWDAEGKLAYVYLLNINGDTIGYYVLKGLPVSYCAGLTPPYDFVDPEGDGGSFQVAAPGVDGVFYSGGQCNQYYGIDATTDTYMEFSIGNGMNYLLSEEPLPRQDAEPLGLTTIEDAAALEAEG